MVVELEHKVYRVVRKLNINMEESDQKRVLQLNELVKFRLHAYENDKLYKEN